MFVTKNIVSQRELEIALNDLNRGQLKKEMGNLVVLVEKTNSNSDKFFEAFIESKEILLKKLRLSIGKSSLYRFFVYKIDELNSILKLIEPSLFFVERRAVKKGSQMLTSYCVNPNCSILESESFFVLKFNGENDIRIHSE